MHSKVSLSWRWKHKSGCSLIPFFYPSIHYPTEQEERPTTVPWLSPWQVHGRRTLHAILSLGPLACVIIPFAKSPHSCIRVIHIVCADYHSLAVSLTCPVLFLPEVFLLS